MTICHHTFIELDQRLVMQPIISALSLALDPTFVGDALKLALNVALALSCDESQVSNADAPLPRLPIKTSE